MPYNGPKEKQEQRREATSSRKKLGIYELE